YGLEPIRLDRYRRVAPSDHGESEEEREAYVPAHQARSNGEHGPSAPREQRRDAEDMRLGRRGPGEGGGRHGRCPGGGRGERRLGAVAASERLGPDVDQAAGGGPLKGSLRGALVRVVPWFAHRPLIRLS